MCLLVPPRAMCGSAVALSLSVVWCCLPGGLVVLSVCSPSLCSLSMCNLSWYSYFLCAYQAAAAAAAAAAPTLSRYGEPSPVIRAGGWGSTEPPHPTCRWVGWLRYHTCMLCCAGAWLRARKRGGSGSRRHADAMVHVDWSVVCACGHCLLLRCIGRGSPTQLLGCVHLLCAKCISSV